MNNSNAGNDDARLMKRFIFCPSLNKNAISPKIRDMAFLKTTVLVRFFDIYYYLTIKVLPCQLLVLRSVRCYNFQPVHSAHLAK